MDCLWISCSVHMINIRTGSFWLPGEHSQASVLTHMWTFHGVSAGDTLSGFIRDKWVTKSIKGLCSASIDASLARSERAAAHEGFYVNKRKTQSREELLIMNAEKYCIVGGNQWPHQHENTCWTNRAEHQTELRTRRNKSNVLNDVTPGNRRRSSAADGRGFFVSKTVTASREMLASWGRH